MESNTEQEEQGEEGKKDDILIILNPIDTGNTTTSDNVPDETSKEQVLNQTAAVTKQQKTTKAIRRVISASIESENEPIDKNDKPDTLAIPSLPTTPQYTNIDQIAVGPLTLQAGQLSVATPITMYESDDILVDIDADHPLSPLGPRTLSSITNEARKSVGIYDTRHFGTEIKQKAGGMLLPFIGTIILLIAVQDDDSAFYKMMAVCVGGVGVAFYGNFAYMILRSRNLHRIRIITKKHRDFGNIILGAEIQELPAAPLKSMSELFALRGSSVNGLSLVSMSFISAFMSAAILYHYIDLHQNGDKSLSYIDSQYVEIWFAIPSTIATAFISTFDLNSNDIASIGLHYFGVFLMVISVFAYNIQQHWSSFSIFVTASAYFVFGMFFYLVQWKHPDRIEIKEDVKLSDIDIEDIKIKVHNISQSCLFTELLGIILVTFSNCLFLWNLKRL